MPSLLTSSDNDPTATRQALRRAALVRRQALHPTDCAALSQAICAHLLRHFPQLSALSVGFCWPVRNEPDLRPALATWRAAGHDGFAAGLPVTENIGAGPMRFRAWTPDAPLHTDRHGIPTPTSGPYVQPQALLIPLVVFDANGYRLGYGGGYFDRTLAGLRPRPLAIGVGYELSRAESIHPQPHDERLDAIVTEAGLVFGG